MKHVTIGSDAQEVHVENDDTQVDLALYLRTLVRIVRRNALLIAGLVIGTVFAGVVVTMLMTPTYKAQAQILIQDQADQIIEGGELQKAGAAWDTDRFLQTQLGILRSGALARDVVQSAGLDRSAEFFAAMAEPVPIEVGAARQEAAVSALQRALSVNLPSDSRIATLTIRSGNAPLSAWLANFYAERYIRYNLGRKDGSSAYARRFLIDQLEQARSKLAQSERDLNRYARAAGLIRVSSEDDKGGQDAALSITNNTLVQLNTAAAAATAERIAAQNRWQALSDQPVLTVPEVNANTGVMQLVAQKATAEAALAEELSRHLDRHPSIKAKRAEIAELDRRIDTFANAIRQSAQVDYRAALDKEKSLLAQVGKVRAEALNEQDRGVQYTVLKRVADTNRHSYEALLARYNQLNATAGAASSNVTLLARADVPRSPDSPQLVLNVALAFVLGVVIAGVVVALKELLDDTLRSPEDVEKKLGLSLLGLIPLRKEGGMHRHETGEAFGSLATNLRYSTPGGLPKVLAVTSARAGEGKSTIAEAVAEQIAALGKNVLLVDADLRRPTLHHALEEFSPCGLPDVLTGRKHLDEVVKRSPHAPTLSYLLGVPVPPDPAHILAGEGLVAFVAQARERFDVVVLDCPPVLGLSDAPLLASQADGVLFVIDGARFHRGAIKTALARLALVHANLLGAALNRFEADEDHEYYAEEYYSYGAAA